MYLQFPAVEGSTEIVAQSQASEGSGCHVGMEDLVAGLTALLDPVHRLVRLPQEVSGPPAPGGGSQGDTHAGGYEDPMPFCGKGGAQLLRDALGDPDGPAPL